LQDWTRNGPNKCGSKLSPREIADMTTESSETFSRAATALFGPAMLANPYPVYSRLRETDPVHWHAPFGAWMLTRYDDVAAAVHDPGLSSERAEPLRQLAGRVELGPFFDSLACRMDFKEPPAHTRLRGLVTKAFTPHAIDALGPHIEELVHQFLDRV